MTIPPTGALGAAAVMHAAQLTAIKACGTLVRVEPQQFAAILARQDAPLVVTSTGGIFRKHFRYLTSYRGLAFHCQSRTPLQLPQTAETIAAKTLSIPDA